jgi:hypothetical protein
MAVYGNSVQEERLNRMGEAAHSVFPEISVIAFKGTFRYAIDYALHRHDLEDWEMISGRDPREKEAFFESVLGLAAERLKKQSVNDEQIGRVIHFLKDQKDEWIK